MLIALPFGYLSIVAADPRFLDPDRIEDEWIQIRARSRSHLDELRDRVDLAAYSTVSTPEADYPYRIVLPQSRFLALIQMLLASEIRYSNFKQVVAETTKDRNFHQFVTTVWAIGRRVLDDRYRDRIDPIEDVDLEGD